MIGPKAKEGLLAFAFFAAVIAAMFLPSAL
ncbi:hypothetical protein EDF51_106118 [Curtobacterium sp. PhB25]|nr:hypothetical protein EDF51_106118 [Curtobacterium sp. PhB25]